MVNYIILLPPSEGKQKSGNFEVYYEVKEKNSFIELDKYREFICNKLFETINNSLESDLEKLFDVKGNNLTTVLEYSKDIFNSQTLRAIDRFSGVMFNAIDYKNLDEKQKKIFDDCVLFIDGLFGLLKPLDLIPNYKLKINSKLIDFDVTNFWREKLKNILDNLFEDKIIIDILPEAHRKVLGSYDNLYSVKFCEIKDGKVKNVGHISKKLKGDLIKYLVSFDEISLDDLKKFEHEDGFFYSEEFSSENDVVYLKK